LVGHQKKNPPPPPPPKKKKIIYTCFVAIDLYSDRLVLAF